MPVQSISATTLGCKVNQYDTNAMLELFRAAGYQIVPWGAASDIALVNTCTVTQTADRKSRAAIRQAARRGSAVLVCGCLAQKEKETLLRLDGVRWVIGTSERAEVVSIVEAGSEQVAAGIRQTYEELKIHAPAERTRAFVKVQEGCAHFCSYCIIPYVRGRPQSRDRSSVLEEISRLSAAGVNEVVLTGIDLASYESGGDLADLVAAVGDHTPVRRLRLGSLEPGLFTDSFVRRLASSEILCPHFHLSLQSGSARVLQAMNRHYTPDRFLEELQHLRTWFDNPAISTDVMTGFPGEEESDFRDTLEFARRTAFSRLHVFPYSQREGTAAARMRGQVPVAVRRKRAAELIAAGEELEAAFARSVLSRPQQVLFEEEEDGQASGYCGRYVRVRVPGGRPGAVQTVVPVRAEGCVVFGRLEEDPELC